MAAHFREGRIGGEMRPSVVDSYTGPVLRGPLRSVIIVAAAAISWMVIIALFLGGLQLMSGGFAAARGYLGL